MKRQETILHMLILSTIIITTLIANGCQIGLDSWKDGNPLRWGTFASPESCKIECEYDNPIFEDTKNYETKIGLVSFGSQENDTKAEYCNEAFFYYINNQFLPYVYNNNINYDIPAGDWFDETGVSKTRNVDIKGFFWRAVLLSDALLEENLPVEMEEKLKEVEDMPGDKFDGFKYNYIEVNYEATSTPATNDDMVELRYDFASEFPCNEDFEVNVECAVGSQASAIRCNGEGINEGLDYCETLEDGPGACLGDMVGPLQAVFNQICTGAKVFGLREAINEYTLLQDSIDEDCNIDEEAIEDAIT